MSEETNTEEEQSVIARCPQCGAATGFSSAESMEGDAEDWEDEGRTVEFLPKSRAVAIIRSAPECMCHIPEEFRERVTAAETSRDELAARVAELERIIEGSKHVDEDGNPVGDGDAISFSYGIPPVRVSGQVGWLNGELWVFTPGHNPTRCKMTELREYVGCFYRENPSRAGAG